MLMIYKDKMMTKDKIYKIMNNRYKISNKTKPDIRRLSLSMDNLRLTTKT